MDVEEQTHQMASYLGLAYLLGFIALMLAYGTGVLA